MYKPTAINIRFEEGQLQFFDANTGLHNKRNSSLEFHIRSIAREDNGSITSREFTCDEGDVYKYKSDPNLAQKGTFKNEEDALKVVSRILNDPNLSIYQTTISIGGKKRVYEGVQMEDGVERAKLLVEKRLSELGPDAQTLAAQSRGSSEQGKVDVSPEGDGGERKAVAVPKNQVESLMAASYAAEMAN